MIKKEKYKNYNLYYYDKLGLNLGFYLINKNYKTYKIFKNDKRSFVALIDIQGQKYIYKEYRREYNLIKNKFFSLFKRSEAIKTLENITNMINCGFVEYAEPFVAITYYKMGLIFYSSLIMEYVGEISVGDVYWKERDFYCEKVIEICKKIHSAKVFHGDMNTFNFAIEHGEIKIIDTKAEKMVLGNFRAHYDMITFQKEHFQKMKYPYIKNIWYYLALFTKKMKRLRSKCKECILKSKKE